MGFPEVRPLEPCEWEESFNSFDNYERYLEDNEELCRFAGVPARIEPSYYEKLVRDWGFPGI